jgi:hypothetical protein
MTLGYYGNWLDAAPTLGYERRRRIAGQVSVTFVVLVVLMGLVGTAFYFANQYISTFESSVWDAVESINGAIQRIYGLPERSATISVYVPSNAYIRITGSGDNTVIEATGAFGDRRYRLIEGDAWELIVAGSTTLTSDGRLRVVYGTQERPLKLGSKEIVLGPGRHTLVIRNLNGVTIAFNPVQQGVPTEVLRR